MKREDLRQIRVYGYYGSLGLQVAFSIFIGLGIGLWLDKKAGTSPWLTFVFLIFGIIAGFRNIGLAIKKTRKF